MIASRLKTLAFGLATLAALPAVAAAAGDPTGVWLDAAGRGAVEIAPCDAGGALCGRVVWVKSADHQKRCGEQILGKLEKNGNGTWGGGWIYSPDRGRRFDVEIKPMGADKLQVMGYAGVRMFSETHMWKRAAPDIVRCGTEQTAAAQSKSDTVAAAPIATAPPVTSGQPAQAPAQAPAPAAPTEGRSDKVASTDAENRKTGEKRPSRNGDSKVSAVVEKYFKRSADGTCKVDTPWIKVKFDCSRN